MVEFWRNLLRHNRCSLLLGTLFALLLVQPFLTPGRLGSIMVGLLGTAIIFTAIYAVAARSRHFAIALALGILTAFSTWMASILQGKVWFLASDVTDAAFYLYISALLLGYVLRPGPVTGDKLVGAVAVYLILASFWARLYHMVYLTVPNSFAGAAAPGESVDVVDTDVFTYFSFVTLTTLGYGDISPASPPARTLAMLQAAVGVLFLAVMLARLVALYSGTRHQGTEDG